MQVTYAIPGVAIQRITKNCTEGSDAALIESIAKGDRGAMHALYKRHDVYVYRFALRLTGNPSIAEDIVNEVFFEVWRQAAGFEAKSKVSTWLLGIARNKALSALRRRSDAQLDERFASTIEDLADNPEEATDKVNRGEVLQRCLKQLSPAQREVVDLVYYHGKTVAEVSEIVVAPVRTVKTRMFYARKRLAGLLAASGIHTACA
jgi:RNA polymerase sigma-70 factor (ECF subfamily)